MKTRYFIECSFDGTAYNGWQVQKNTRKTIQYIVNQTLKTALREEIETGGCGRTDSGVHARQFFFDLECRRQELEAEKGLWLHKFNTMLPEQISFHDIRRVRPGISARWDAIRRTYCYYITRKRDPFMVNRAWYRYGQLDLAAMNKAAASLLHHRDFASFCKGRSQNKTTICKVDEAAWKETGDLLIFTISADRFLRNMVRALTGTLTDIGKGRISLDDLEKIILRRQRTSAGMSVPACGLYLEKVEYPSGIFLS